MKIWTSFESFPIHFLAMLLDRNLFKEERDVLFT